MIKSRKVNAMFLRVKNVPQFTRILRESLHQDTGSWSLAIWIIYMTKANNIQILQHSFSKQLETHNNQVLWKPGKDQLEEKGTSQSAISPWYFFQFSLLMGRTLIYSDSPHFLSTEAIKKMLYTKLKTVLQIINKHYPHRSSEQVLKSHCKKFHLS